MAHREARIATERAQRYLDQLCDHLGHMRHMARHGGMPDVTEIERSAGSAVVRFADGVWRLEASASVLVLRVEADDPAALERHKSAISARVAKIGRRDELSVDWH